jgi:hypothetical protein
MPTDVICERTECMLGIASQADRPIVIAAE